MVQCSCMQPLYATKLHRVTASLFSLDTALWGVCLTFTLYCMERDGRNAGKAVTQTRNAISRRELFQNHRTSFFNCHFCFPWEVASDVRALLWSRNFNITGKDVLSVTESDYYTITTTLFRKTFARTLVMSKYTHLLMSENVANVTPNLYA